jgi:hypothetical protein
VFRGDLTAGSAAPLKGNLPGVRVELPAEIAVGDWRLVVEATDGLTPAQDVTTIRVT